MRRSRQNLGFWDRLCLESVFLVVAWLAAVSVSSAADWPQFLGPTRDGVYSGETLASRWPKDGPPKVWFKPLGQGFSGSAVQAGKVIVFHRLNDQEVVDCLDAASGDPVWHFQYPSGYRDSFGFDEGPRATPLIAGGKVYTFGAEGALHCLDFTSGSNLWTVPVNQQFHVPKGFFGTATSPILVDGKVLLNVGGPNGSGIVAFHPDTGAVLWKATDHEASYSSPVSAMLDGKSRALFLTRSGLLALDPANGKVQFDFPWRARAHASVNAASPLVMGNFIFLSACYETGAVLLKVNGNALDRIWASDDVLSNHYATSVHRDGFLYGFHGRQESGPSLRCIQLAKGKVQWSQEGFGAGSLLLAGDQLLVLKENGELLLIEASPEKYRERGRAQILPNGVRAYPALANGFLFARSKDVLACLDLRTSH